MRHTIYEVRRTADKSILFVGSTSRPKEDLKFKYLTKPVQDYLTAHELRDGGYYIAWLEVSGPTRASLQSCIRGLVSQAVVTGHNPLNVQATPAHAAEKRTVSPEQVAEIQERVEAGHTTAAISRDLGISFNIVSQVRSGGSHKHLTGGMRTVAGHLRSH